MLLRTSFQPQVLLVPTKSYSTEKAKRNQRDVWEALKCSATGFLTPQPQATVPPANSTQLSPPPKFSLLLEGQEQPRVQDVLFWLPAVVSGKAKSGAGEQHPGGLPGTLPQPCWEQGALWERQSSEASEVLEVS